MKNQQQQSGQPKQLRSRSQGIAKEAKVGKTAKVAKVAKRGRLGMIAMVAKVALLQCPEFNIISNFTSFMMSL